MLILNRLHFQILIPNRSCTRSKLLLGFLLSPSPFLSEQVPDFAEELEGTSSPVTDGGWVGARLEPRHQARGLAVTETDASL